MLFGIKIMILLVFILLYSIFNPQNAVTFLITFFAVYLIHTVFVVIKVLNTLKNKTG
jgi:F0F1-type ATP synthase assembly protein I